MRHRDEHGQVTVLIIGFAAILLMAVVLVVDASAAYLQRQGLDSLADGAALYGADLGADGIYERGVGSGRLMPDEAAVRAAVADYLADTRAERRFPGIRVRVVVHEAERSVTVAVEAPLDLPLKLPGSPAQPLVTASSTASVTIIPG